MSYQSALSGLNAAQTSLDVVSNNIANINSVGFKRSRAEFSDLIDAGQANTGSLVVGRGAQLNSINQQFTQGNLITTGVAFDLAIQGLGFFPLTDGGGQIYSRNGQFHVDKDGRVVNSVGHRLQAFQPDGSGGLTSTTSDLAINTADIAPLASSLVGIGMNFDASEPPIALPFDPTNPLTYNKSTSLTIFDGLGLEHTATLFLTKTADNFWDARIGVDGAVVGGATVLEFNSAGTLIAPVGGVLSRTFTPSGGAGPQTLDINLGTSTQFGGPFSVNALTQDGYTSGRLSGVNVGADGIVLARYSNGQTAVQGQIPLANFANPDGLTQVGDTSWGETSISGSALIGAPGTAQLGTLASGALEESNVDITEMLIELITAQRNFQANAKSIQSSDTITETVIQLQ